MDAGDAVDLTKSSDTATEDYDLPPFNCKNVLLVIDQHRVNCKGKNILKFPNRISVLNRQEGYKYIQEETTEVLFHYLTVE